jgi:hypothetical protein
VERVVGYGIIQDKRVEKAKVSESLGNYIGR